MLKKIFFIILSFNLLSHCDYKPVYSKQNNAGLKIIISGFTGDKDINNFIASNVDRSSKKETNEIVKINFNTDYTKKILAKNSAGTITDYQSDVVTTFVIRKDNTTDNFIVREKFNFKKMNDKHKEKNYELNIKRNLANSISRKLILRLAVN
tara:strand:+ start:365 stop:820 length:456 start_codon:yes stop_codon:yes gene_type:complete